MTLSYVASLYLLSEARCYIVWNYFCKIYNYRMLYWLIGVGMLVYIIK
jgi:hypothetical protein